MYHLLTRDCKTQFQAKSNIFIGVCPYPTTTYSVSHDTFATKCNSVTSDLSVLFSNTDIADQLTSRTNNSIASTKQHQLCRDVCEPGEMPGVRAHHDLLHPPALPPRPGPLRLLPLLPLSPHFRKHQAAGMIYSGSGKKQKQWFGV